MLKDNTVSLGELVSLATVVHGPLPLLHGSYCTAVVARGQGSTLQRKRLMPVKLADPLYDGKMQERSWGDARRDLPLRAKCSSEQVGYLNRDSEGNYE